MPDLKFEPKRVKYRCHTFIANDLKANRNKKGCACAVAQAITVGPRFDTDHVAYWPDVNDTCEQSLKDRTESVVENSVSVIADGHAYLPTVVIGNKKQIETLMPLVTKELEAADLKLKTLSFDVKNDDHQFFIT